MHSNLLSSYMRSILSRRLLYPSGRLRKKGSIAMAKLFSTICQMIRESRLPENSRQGLVLISMSHTFPLESMRKSYPNISKLNIFLSALSLSSADFILMSASSFILSRVCSQWISLDLRKTSRSLKDNLLQGSYFPQSLCFFWTASLVRCPKILLGSQLNSLQQVRKYPSLYQYAFRVPQMEVTRAQQRMSNFLFLQSSGSMYYCTSELFPKVASSLIALRMLFLPYWTVIPVPLLVSSPGLMIQMLFCQQIFSGRSASLPSMWQVLGMMEFQLTFSILQYFLMFLKRHFLSDISQWFLRWLCILSQWTMISFMRWVLGVTATSIFASLWFYSFSLKTIVLSRGFLSGYTKLDPRLACYQSQNCVHTILASFLDDMIFKLLLLRMSSLISRELLPSSMNTLIFSFFCMLMPAMPLYASTSSRKICFCDSYFQINGLSIRSPGDSIVFQSVFFSRDILRMNLVPTKFREVSVSPRQLSRYRFCLMMLWMGKILGSSKICFSLRKWVTVFSRWRVAFVGELPVMEQFCWWMVSKYSSRLEPRFFINKKHLIKAGPNPIQFLKKWADSQQLLPYYAIDGLFIWQSAFHLGKKEI